MTWESEPSPIWTLDGWQTIKARTVTIDGLRLTIPEGFVFDLSSIPRPLRFLADRTELGVKAPLIHDFLYRYRGAPPVGTLVPPEPVSRVRADRLFLLMMKHDGIGPVRRRLAWLGVRIGGWVPWPPERTTIYEAVTRAFHTAWQSAAALWLVDGWWVPVVAAGLAMVKSIIAPWLKSTIESAAYD